MTCHCRSTLPAVATNVRMKSLSTFPLWPHGSRNRRVRCLTRPPNRRAQAVGLFKGRQTKRIPAIPRIVKPEADARVPRIGGTPTEPAPELQASQFLRLQIRQQLAQFRRSRQLRRDRRMPESAQSAGFGSTSPWYPTCRPATDRSEHGSRLPCAHVGQRAHEIGQRRCFVERNRSSASTSDRAPSRRSS